ncbi:MAG: MAE_28990/MAE_18760 family HEPN-like nuclease [Caulobacter sp.]|nr:MAE_28990/MAE_18760 family HEPN-like nuclease [Caulobacter sp.]
MPPCFEPILAEVAPDRVEWRIIDHCTAVTRLYAIYEHFAHQLIVEHLSLLQTNFRFAELPPSVQVAYRSGLSKIMEKKDGPRYAEIDLAFVVNQYGLALGGKKFVLEPKAMLAHEQNLRLSELGKLFAASGMPGIESWISKSPSISVFFDCGDRVGGSAEAELAELIKYRNEAAHGGIVVDDVLGPETLAEFCTFMEVLCGAMADFVRHAGLACLLRSGAAEVRGTVNSCIKAGSVIVGPMVGKFAVGDTIYLFADGYAVSGDVLSIQLDDEDLALVNLEKERQLGLRLATQGRKGCAVVALVEMVEDRDSASDSDAALGVVEELVEC